MFSQSDSCSLDTAGGHQIGKTYTEQSHEGFFVPLRTNIYIDIYHLGKQINCNAEFLDICTLSSLTWTTNKMNEDCTGKYWGHIPGINVQIIRKWLI